ncbi:NUDIX hydrolase [Propionibacterium sp.]|uniref:NUDIX hydrolase n=1 Tax=Propionibacterium sp. TaxID=1977903 RepID=UPI0039E9C3BD
MHITGFHRLDEGPSVRIAVHHGDDPRLLLWSRGWAVAQWLSATGTDDDILLTAQVRRRTQTTRLPRRHGLHALPDADPAPGEVPVPRQRIAAYAVVRSPMGMLGTMCSDHTAVPGRWQLPGGGLEPGETPSEAVMREVTEETAQSVHLLRVVDLQSDHWVGRGPSGQLEDFQALRIIYTAICSEPTQPIVLDVDGTTAMSRWVPVRHWRSLPWTAGARSALDKYLDTVRVPRLAC